MLFGMFSRVKKFGNFMGYKKVWKHRGDKERGIITKFRVRMKKIYIQGEKTITITLNKN